jgi:hypothetical protein
MPTFVTLIITAFLGSVAITVAMARKYRWRWGHRRIQARQQVADGPFRRANTTTTGYKPLGVPISKKALSVASILWGLATGLIFAPAGVIFLLVAGELSTNAFAVLGMIGVIGVVCSGFALAVSLCRASGAVLARNRERLQQTARWSAFHHLAVIASFAAFGEPELFLLAFVPCLFGLAHAHWLQQTARSQPVEDVIEVAPEQAAA